MTEDALIRKLKALIAFRILFVTIILGSFLLFRIGYGVLPYFPAVQYIIVFLYSLTFLYAFALGRVKSRPFAYVQLCVDVVGSVVLVGLTGGIESWFTTLLPLIVLGAAIVVDKGAGYATAALGSALYGLAIYMQFHGLMPLPYDGGLMVKEFVYKFFSVTTALVLTAYLAGLLVSRLERKDIDLRDLAVFNKEVIENTPSGLFTTDLDGTVRLFNRAAENITGLDRAGIIGRGIREAFPFIERLAERKRMEERVFLGGSEKVIGLSISHMRDASGSGVGFIGTFQDLTELKKMADEIKTKEKLAAIGEMAANMAHEIRNPLASLKGSMEMLMEDAVSEEQKDRLMHIALNEMDRLNNVITDFLNYSRPMVLNIREFDLHEVMGRTLELLKNNGSLAASVVFRNEFNGPLRIRADSQKLQQVFWNLGLNALDAMPEGGELVASTASENGMVRISIRDTGCGISPADMGKVFYPFFTTKKHGVGLGLSIAYRIVQEHRGAMSIKSEPGKGTQFDILIPGAA